MAVIPAHRSARNGFELLSTLTTRDLKLRYQGSVFGWAWSLVRPLALGLVLSFALDTVLRAGITTTFLLTGLFPWFWFQSSVQGSTTTFVGNGGLLKKVRFPRAVLPLSIVLGNTLQFLLALPVLAAFLIIDGYNPEPVWLVGIPVLFLVQLLLTCGVSLFISTATVFFRDLEHITEVLLTLLFYGTPIIYSADHLPERYEWILRVNPLAPVMEGWRTVLLDGEFPGSSFWIAVALTAVAVVVGWWTFRHFEDAFADVV